MLSMDHDGKLFLVFVLSGKRKSGKDYVAQALHDRFGSKSCIIRLSAPLKEQYAMVHLQYLWLALQSQENEMDFKELLSSSAYKESCRLKMIVWGEEKRKQNPSVFCELATKDKHNFPIWIISDARRKTDISYFRSRYSEIVKTVRINADIAARQSRGFTFVEGVDDADSECALDDIEDWDFTVTNNGETGELDKQLETIVRGLQKYTSLDIPSL